MLELDPAARPREAQAALRLLGVEVATPVATPPTAILPTSQSSAGQPTTLMTPPGTTLSPVPSVQPLVVQPIIIPSFRMRRPAAQKSSTSRPAILVLALWVLVIVVVIWVISVNATSATAPAFQAAVVVQQSPTDDTAATATANALTAAAIVQSHVQATAQASATAAAITAEVVRNLAVATTATSAAQASATDRANATAEAQVQASATIQAIEATVTTRERLSQRVYGPVDGQMEHDNDAYIEEHYAGIELVNPIIEVSFTNPYNASQQDWDYGVLFRSDYWLYVGSGSYWALDYKGERLVGGELSKLDISEYASNQLRLVIVGEKALFFVNSSYIATLDVSDSLAKSDVRIATGLLVGHEVVGKTTRYENFTIWAIP